MVIFVSAIGMSTACDTLFPQVVNLNIINSNYKLDLHLLLLSNRYLVAMIRKKWVSYFRKVMDSEIIQSILKKTY